MDIPAEQEAVLIPKEYTDALMLDLVAQAFRDIRLRALQTDPTSFSSCFATESEQPHSFWTERLQNPQAKTFALVHEASGVQHHHHPEFTLLRPWLGILVLLGPKLVDIDVYDNDSPWKTVLTEQHAINEQPQLQEMEASSVKIALAYQIVSVYVAAEFRGKGLAKKLMSSALAAIEQDLKNKRFGKAVCTVDVADGISVARNLYQRMGFVTVAEDQSTTDNGREFHGSVMRKAMTFQATRDASVV
ncbi:hypothetical protein EPUS_05976 [Endocarpon pusillum Z07020]|uniref:N-acetyltransferase domain-containing protein n=1 Tax=Endocarpon pusillum (strain Z07020 / HMAS-L-300199) TaxID=1263415 RepID=U1G1N8_ENDPU|nr:uncharacterized protein EPUS_05976 [Endocarpon pusillum Z07020]ERF71147.1 hypothetical protein EPUS_05976 [Endocarpon pusillum Z07020]